MENLTVIASNETPYIKLDFIKHQLNFEGISKMPDATTTYDPVIEWLDLYNKIPKSIKTQVIFKFDYVNEQSQIFLHYIITKLDEMNHSIEIHWYFDSEEMEELGVHLEDYTDIPFNFIELP